MSYLAAHIRDAGLTQAQFAETVGVDQATVSKLCRGKLVPSLPLAVRIERATRGEVAASSWVPEKDAA
ncbi:helix-turn-helix transcriptional regulator [Xinfangfangia pollutisoli]|uniref:helix-turn-helix transcriptional regulator n=1 Tax=Xinfangfangia pollutisoli TaxID=2865960 RepID=UPI001CD781CD|nr:helix-turn-helix transcriptional regulator [Xinfangfangia pollutisoli]